MRKNIFMIILSIILNILFCTNVFAAPPEKTYTPESNAFTITIPKELTLSGETGTINYEINVKGVIAEDQIINITPNTNFEIVDNGGKENIVANITQMDTAFNSIEIATTENNSTNVVGKTIEGVIQTTNLSAGEWNGNFEFDIKINEHTHVFNDLITKEATCIETGIRTYTCTKCGDIYNEDIPINPNAHHYTSEITKEPTCTEYGVRTYTCECGDSYTENIEKNSHDYEETIVNDVITYVCKNCGDSYINNNDHTHSYTSTITKESTCTEQGVKTYTCECGDSYIENIAINPDNHDYDDGVITKEPTFTETGIKTYTCSRCSDTYTEPIPMKYLPTKDTFNNMSWVDIATVSEAGKAPEYFSVGDEKELQIGSETYHVQILGFNHDDKSDGSGKAGITVGLKEIMTTTHAMNSASDEYEYGDNIGGWTDCEMRTYLQTNIYNILPDDVKSVIKTVDKISDIGNKDTVTLNITRDNIFLFSTTEVGGNSFTFWDVDNQGTQYEFFTDNISRIKYLNNVVTNWGLRSASTYDISFFCGINSNGNYSYSYAYVNRGVVFGFCI